MAFTPDPPGFDICWMGICYLFNLKLGYSRFRKTIFFQKSQIYLKILKKRKIIYIFLDSYTYTVIIFLFLLLLSYIQENRHRIFFLHVQVLLYLLMVVLLVFLVLMIWMLMVCCFVFYFSIECEQLCFYFFSSFFYNMVYIGLGKQIHILM